MNKTELQQMYDKLNSQFITKTAIKSQLVSQQEELQKKIDMIDIQSLEEAGIVLQQMSASQMESARIKLEELGTFALQYSLGPNYKMEIDIKKARGKSAAEVYILKTDSGIRTSPEDGNGGGVIDIISIALRFITMQTYMPFIDGPIILDEPYKMVSEEYVPMISSFLKNLSIDFGRQILLCTHNKFLAQIADKQIHVSMIEGNESVTVEQ